MSEKLDVDCQSPTSSHRYPSFGFAAGWIRAERPPFIFSRSHEAASGAAEPRLLSVVPVRTGTAKAAEILSLLPRFPVCTKVPAPCSSIYSSPTESANSSSKHTFLLTPAAPDVRPRILRWPTNYRLSAEKIHEDFKRLDHINDRFLDLREDEVQLLANPDQGPPSPARQLRHHETTVGPSSSRSYAKGKIISSDITPVAGHTTENPDFGVLFEMLKSQEQVSLNIQDIVTDMNRQMNIVVGTLSTLTGLVQRLFETSSSGRKRIVNPPVSQYQFKRRRKKNDNVGVVDPVNIDVPGQAQEAEETIRDEQCTNFLGDETIHEDPKEVDPTKDITHVLDPVHTNVPGQTQDAEDTIREIEDTDLGDETIHEDPKEVERAIKGVLESVSFDSRDGIPHGSPLGVMYESKLCTFLFGAIIKLLASFAVDDLKRGSTGLGWDPIKRIIDASEEWWTKRIAVVPAAKNYKTCGIEPDLEEKLDLMFGGVVATKTPINEVVATLEQDPSIAADDELYYFPVELLQDSFQRDFFTAIAKERRVSYLRHFFERRKI
ncbi:uncharacterized protein LOC110022948 [Phalaenopsis equestris]|uniref:uncharacterized protein LOC110022948 n=1 Tax=Phalaenopsis equestris TaxID=78828 RepID=UPI0009E1E5C7|nr:uncharacterized protein LOC110022948 [Phalaenopsis equestris]